MSWIAKPIGAFCHTGSGGTPSRQQESRFYGGSIPWVKSGELKESIVFETEETITEAALVESSAKLIPPGALLVAMYGATVGRIAILGIEAASNQAVCHIVPDESAADQRYLFYALRIQVPRWLEQRVGGAQPNISQQIIRDTQIPLPPLEEQRRIAAILDKADAVRRKRQKAIALTEELLRSAFLELFGDPVANSKGWDILPMDKVVQRIEAGWSANGEDCKCMENEWGVLKISAVTSGRFQSNEHKVVKDIVFKKSLIIPQRGDLLFSRANTRELVAATCLVEENCERLFLPDKLWRITPDPNIANTEYLRFLLTDPAYRRLITRKATGTSGSMLNVSQAKLLEMYGPIPPLTVQKHFAEVVWQAFDMRERHESAFAMSDSAFNSLLQRAFRGEL